MFNIQDLAQVLGRAVAIEGGNADDRKAADAQLKIWETQPGFHAFLLDISNAAELPFRVRHLASICLKNGIDKYWRKTASNALGADEKAKIREGLSVVICTESKPLSKTYSEALAKIARLDFPREWPNLLDVLVATVRGAFSQPIDIDPSRRYTLQRHSVYVFHRVIKELYSMRIIHHKRLHYQMTPELFQYFQSLYVSTADNFISIASKPMDPQSLIIMEGEVEIARFSLKCLRTLICYGYPEKAMPDLQRPTFDETEACIRLFESMPGYLTKFLQIRHSTSGNPQVSASTCVKALESICIAIGKIYRDLQQYRFVNFCLAPTAMDVVKTYWNNVTSYYRDNRAPPEDPFVEKFLLQGMHILRAMIKSDELQVAQGDQRHPRADEAKAKIRDELLTTTFISSAMEILILKIMLLSPADLEKWESEPEAFIDDEKNESAEFSLRLAAENAVYEFVHQNQTIFSPFLVNILRQVSGISAKADVPSLLIKDAVYNSLGLCSYDLVDHIDFNGWFESSLIHEVDVDAIDPGASILNRRVCKLISAFCNVNMEPRLRTKVYELLVGLGLPGKDLVVRLAAISALRDVIGEAHNGVDDFLEFSDTAINVTLQTVEELEEFDTRVAVIDCLTSIVAHLGSHIPRLWQLAEIQPVLKAAIIGLIKELIDALGFMSVELQPFVLPIVRMSFESNESTAYIEDTLELWQSCLKNSPQVTSQLLELFPWLDKVFDLNSEYLKTGLRILEAYFLLSPQAMYQTKDIVIIFSKVISLLAGLRLEASTATIKSLAICIRASGQTGLMKQCCHALAESGLLFLFVKEILNGSESERMSNYIQANLSSLIGICCVWDASAFLETLDHMAPQFGPFQQPSLLGNLLAAMNNGRQQLYDAVTYKIQKKILGMAMANLLSLGRPDILQGSALIFSTISSVSAEISDLGLDPGRERAFWVDRSEWFEDHDDPKREQLDRLDPMASSPFIPYFKQKLQEAQAAVGGPARFNELVLGDVQGTNPCVWLLMVDEKFGVYIMFPIGSLYLFNRPEIQEMFFTEKNIGETMAIPKSELATGLPRTLEEASDQAKSYRKK
ncbi:Importin-11 [Phlyctochytrium planicorne]|nr:Importin-11 [Phlyctochytrium planicorne]